MNEWRRYGYNKKAKYADAGITSNSTFTYTNPIYQHTPATKILDPKKRYRNADDSPTPIGRRVDNRCLWGTALLDRLLLQGIMTFDRIAIYGFDAQGD
jgi:hypothetical protein